MSLLHMKSIKKKENKRGTRLMLNIEKYKDKIFNRINECELAKAIYFAKEGKMTDCDRKCKLCRDACVRWLLEEAKEPILDDVEKKYLSAVIKPFRTRVNHISKEENPDGSTEFIHIDLSDEDVADFPNFKANTMYKGMEVGKDYTLQELGL